MPRRPVSGLLYLRTIGVQLPVYNFLHSPINVLSPQRIKTTYTESVSHFLVIFPEILHLFHASILARYEAVCQWINFSRGSRNPVEISSLSA